MTNTQTAASSFCDLITPHLPALHRLARRFTRHQVDAQDLVQELLARLYARSERLAGVENLWPWLARSLYHLHVDQARRPDHAWRRHLHMSGSDVLGSDRISSREHFGAAGPDFASEMEYLSRFLSEAVAELPQEQRTVFILHDVKGHELHETATMMGIALGTAKSRLNRARGRLRDSLRRRKVNLSNVVLGDESTLSLGVLTSPAEAL